MNPSTESAALPARQREVWDQIDSACVRQGHGLGWRLLTCPWANFQRAEVALMTLNPGGSSYEPPSLSVEAGSAYVIEGWLGRDPGSSPLQRQVQRLCAIIGVDPAEVLSGYLVPFRSPTWAKLDRSRHALEFGVTLWRDLFRDWRPHLTFTISEVAFQAMHQILKAGPVSHVPSGWGKVSIRTADYDGGRLVGLPHLSRFQLFGGDEGREEVAIRAMRVE